MQTTNTTRRKQGNPTYSVTVTFECHHSAIFKTPAPVKGEEVYCRGCKEYRRVILAPGEYRVRCLGCPLVRSYGRVRLSASRMITQHRRRYPEHSMQLWDGDHLEWTFRPDAMTFQDTDSDDPPF